MPAMSIYLNLCLSIYISIYKVMRPTCEDPGLNVSCRPGNIWLIYALSHPYACPRKEEKR